MRLVLADATPLPYLILIAQVTVLPTLFGRIMVPRTVVNELQHPRTPAPVRTWCASTPAWVDVRQSQLTPGRELLRLGAGEREAILLAQELQADLLLMDDWAGRQAAEQRALPIMGTLRVVEIAAERGLLDLSAVLTRLETANFYMPVELVRDLLSRDAARKAEASKPEGQDV